MAVYEKLLLFWDAQQRHIEDTIAVKQHRLLHSLNKPIFLHLRGTILEYALQLLFKETQKFPTENRPPNLPADCLCKVPKAHGIPCFHTIWKRQQALDILSCCDGVKGHVIERLSMLWCGS
ncbi:hypothetical protein BJ878DRAFT_31468 [Calycina marina]|uniref:SWIM-type domain-containing protein n=1 Tax=Calycina marina TaxID=1763456 RepID=A0A9P7YU00_9HELO|nr:hypothetical protein BJ878DRAFT_31468 [Calycina marina]